MTNTNQMVNVPRELLEQALDAAAAVGMQDVADELDRLLTPTTAATAIRDLDKAEGEQPDLNFHLLALAERSCSLLEDWIQLSNSKDAPLTNQVRETRALLESQSPTWSTAIRDLLAERRRQIHVEGWSKEHDDTERRGELASAAATYALKAIGFTAFEEELWPWTRDWLKPGTPRAMLVKAGALILAELERLDRLSATEVHREN